MKMILLFTANPDYYEIRLHNTKSIMIDRLTAIMYQLSKKNLCLHFNYIEEEFLERNGLKQYDQ